VVVTRVTIREVTYIALDKSFSGTPPQWLFLQDFQTVTETQLKKNRKNQDALEVTLTA
jgi:hypothetical protein